MPMCGPACMLSKSPWYIFILYSQVLPQIPNANKFRQLVVTRINPSAFIYAIRLCPLWDTSSYKIELLNYLAHKGAKYHAFQLSYQQMTKEIVRKLVTS